MDGWIDDAAAAAAGQSKRLLTEWKKRTLVADV